MDRFCLLAVTAAILLAAVLLLGSLWFAPQDRETEQMVLTVGDYPEVLFNDDRVHSIDIILPQVNWDYMVKHATEEQYVICDVVIDGERMDQVGIRPKGNSSLKAISTTGSDRFSFKIEFDHYRRDSLFHGLDKLSLNNLGQDVSCMKDHLTYRMMNEIGIPTPLSSYAQVKVNGRDFGLYLAVESIEDSFALRNYGPEHGNLYKPECFEIHSVTPAAFANTDPSAFQTDFTVLGPGERLDILGTFIRPPFESAFGENMEVASLHYVGDDEARYAVFYDSSVFEQTGEDRRALIDALRNLTEDPERAVDYETVIPYFIVHNFVNNYDGYTGIFVHNYYLREADGKISMIPWDYNLGFGIFTISSAMKNFLGDRSGYTADLALGDAMDDSTSMVNYPIDTPTFTVQVEDRPLLAAVLQREPYLQEYHEQYAAFLDAFFASGRFEELYSKTVRNIAPYVREGQTFYSYERFTKAAEAVHDYCLLREESIRRQLSGILPSTMEGQKNDYAALVDASDLDLACSVTFDSLVFGIRSEDVLEIVDAIAGDNSHDNDGLMKTVSEVTKSMDRLPAVLLRVVRSSGMIQRAIGSAVIPPTLLILSILLLAVVRKRVIRSRRRRR